MVVVLLDDVGFAASSAFGGPCDTPVAERPTASALGYTRLHTTALCAPARQALFTGRNHHSMGMGCITELATSPPPDAWRGADVVQRPGQPQDCSTSRVGIRL